MNRSTNEKKIVFKIKDFYLLFNDKKINKFPDLNKGKVKYTVDFKTYILIIETFLSIYFKEVFYLNKSLYFFLSGTAIKCCNKKYINFENTLINDNVTFLWYDRPKTKIIPKIVLGLARGKQNPMAALRQNYVREYGIDNLPKYADLYNELHHRKTLYKNDHE